MAAAELLETGVVNAAMRSQLAFPAVYEAEEWLVNDSMVHKHLFCQEVARSCACERIQASPRGFPKGRPHAGLPCQEEKTPGHDS